MLPKPRWHWRHLVGRLPLLAAAVALLLVLGAVVVLHPRRKPPAEAPEVPLVMEGPHAYTVSTTDGGPVVDLPVPPRPWKRQVTDCNPRIHTRINGGCWRKLADTPPCEDAYLWQGGCYVPDFRAEAPRTSIGRE